MPTFICARRALAFGFKGLGRDESQSFIQSGLSQPASASRKTPSRNGRNLRLG